MSAQQRLDRLGRPYTSMMDPELRRGRKPPNYGKRYPAEILTGEEIHRLMAACGRGRAGKRNRAIIVVMWRCGLRVSEVLALEPRDVDITNGTVTVRHGKGNRRRVVGLDPTAAAVVERWAATRQTLGVRRGSPLFCTISRDHLGHALAAPYIREALKRLAGRAAIDKRVHPHGFRHTFAVDLLREGVPITMIQKLLGHGDLATTARYLDHLLPLEAVERARARVWPADVAA
jgi:site-specific recombinase XerD